MSEMINNAAAQWLKDKDSLSQILNSEYTDALVSMDCKPLNLNIGLNSRIYLQLRETDDIEQLDCMVSVNFASTSDQNTGVPSVSAAQHFISVKQEEKSAT